ncbi:hypothetical protein GCM10009117_01120 [Gangjinia marincola]|uniref:VWA domain-containing protein n=1 Tax=Gangjinia marincola TaxID=578463 RepID=A0ABN1MD88_9FLAO
MSTLTIFLIVLAVILAAGLAWFQYGARKKALKLRWWYLGLRFASVFLLLLLLINPSIKQTTYTIVKPVLAILTDDSSSLTSIADTTQVKKLVSALSANEEINERFEVKQYRFGSELSLSNKLSFAQGETNVEKALSDVARIHNESTAPIIVVTDGNQTYGRDYQYVNLPKEHVVYPLIVGDTTHYNDVYIKHLNVNRYSYLNNEFPVEAILGYSGEGDIETTFSLRKNGQTVYTREVRFSNENSTQIISFNVKATQTGVQTYVAGLSPLQDEKNIENNSAYFGIEVIDERTKVLILSSFVHPDLGAIKTAIEGNEQREAEIKINPTGDISVEDYQMLVFYQPNAGLKLYLDKSKAIGINSLVITGTQTDYTLLTEYGIEKQNTTQTEDYLPVFNPNYSVFQFEDIGFRDFPPLNDSFGKISITKPHEVLLYRQISSFNTTDPLLFSVEENSRRMVFLLGENSWKWRAKSYRDTESFESFDGFVNSLVQFLSSTKKRSRLSLDYTSFYNGGENLIIGATYVDKNYQFDPGASLTISLSHKETNEKINRPMLLKANNFQVKLSDMPPGEYDFTVKVADKNISASGSFTLIPFNAEAQFLRADVTKLKALATNTNGTVFYPYQVEEMINRLMADEKYTPVQIGQDKVVPLIDWKYLLALIVTLFSIEWFLRKYNGLI